MFRSKSKDIAKKVLNSEIKVVTALQPIVHYDTYKVINKNGKYPAAQIYGYEALTRYYKEGKLVSLGDKFFDDVTKSNLGCKLDIYLINLHLNVIRNGSFPTNRFLFINVDIATLKNTDHLKTIKGFVDDLKEKAGQVVFEITERSNLKLADKLKEIDKIYKEMKPDCQFALDDHGNKTADSDEFIEAIEGKSSLIRYLKLDRDWSNSTGPVSIHAINSLNESFGGKIILEGINEVKLLANLDGKVTIKYLQSYLFGEPNPNLSEYINDAPVKTEQEDESVRTEDKGKEEIEKVVIPPSDKKAGFFKKAYERIINTRFMKSIINTILIILGVISLIYIFSFIFNKTYTIKVTGCDENEILIVSCASKNIYEEISVKDGIAIFKTKYYNSIVNEYYIWPFSNKYRAWIGPLENNMEINLLKLYWVRFIDANKKCKSTVFVETLLDTLGKAPCSTKVDYIERNNFIFKTNAKIDSIIVVDIRCDTTIIIRYEYPKKIEKPAKRPDTKPPKELIIEGPSIEKNKFNKSYTGLIKSGDYRGALILIDTASIVIESQVDSIRIRGTKAKIYFQWMRFEEYASNSTRAYVITLSDSSAKYARKCREDAAMLLLRGINAKYHSLDTVSLRVDSTWIDSAYVAYRKMVQLGYKENAENDIISKLPDHKPPREKAK